MGTSCSTPSPPRWRPRSDPSRARHRRRRRCGRQLGAPAGRRRGRQRHRDTGSDLVGAGCRIGSGEAARLGRSGRHLAATGRADPRAAQEAAGLRCHPLRPGGHGRIVVGSRGHHPHLRCCADGARLHRSRSGARGPRRPPDRDRRDHLVEVGVDARDRQPEAHLRGVFPQRRHRSDGAHHRRHRPRFAPRQLGARRRISGVQRRPERRRPLLGADGLRPRAERPRRCRHRQPARRGRGRDVRAGLRQARQSGTGPRCGDRRHLAAERQARHRRGRHVTSSVSPTGQNSSSPSPPASSARASCRWCSTSTPPS